MATAGDRIVRDRPGLIARMLRGDRVQDGISREDAQGYAARLRRPESAHASMLLYRSYLRAAASVLGRRGGGSRRLRPPTHFLFGTNDRAIPQQLLDGIERHCDDIVVELVPDSGHFIAEEKPELIAERAAELFERHPVAGQDGR
jgi:pimeloyl-ACP methyl ester carboxylesterase